MDSFEQKIIEAVNEKLSDGTVERLIEEKLEKGISEALDSAFGWNGSAKKMIESRFNEVLTPAIERHDFNQYVVKLDEILTHIVNNTNLKENKKIIENFQELMKEPDFKEIKLSEIFKRYCKHVSKNISTDYLDAMCDDGEPYYEHVTARMEVEYEDNGWFKSDYDDCKVMFICEKDKDLNCQIKLYKRTNDAAWSILYGADSIDLNSLRSVSDFDVFLSVIKRGFVKIIMDVEYDCDDDIEPEEKPE